MKKLKLFSLALLLAISYSIAAQGVSINEDGSTAEASAMLDVQSTDKGFLPPRMTQAQRDAINSPVAGLVVWCIDCAELQVYNGTDWTNMVGDAATAPPVPAVGDYMQGGVVFYVDGNGGGMVCAVSDQSPEANWGCEGTLIVGADGIAIGTGNQNTIDILSGCPASEAANACKILINGYNDWYLPSQDELNQMYLNRVAINTTAGANEGDDFEPVDYWSSTEQNDADAQGQHFGTGSQGNFSKDSKHRVRAVRSF